jgi:hypothetical protein
VIPANLLSELTALPNVRTDISMFVYEEGQLDAIVATLAEHGVTERERTVQEPYGVTCVKASTGVGRDRFEVSVFDMRAATERATAGAPF